MTYSDSKLKEIFDKGNGKCHICGQSLQLSKHGMSDQTNGAWEVDHVKPKDKEGSSSLRNLLPACPKCNREKGSKYPF